MGRKRKTTTLLSKAKNIVTKISCSCKKKVTATLDQITTMARSVSKQILFVGLKTIQKVKRIRKIVRKYFCAIRPPNKKKENCAICLCTIQDSDPIPFMCHGHVLHAECMQSAILNGIHTCPLCRAAVPSGMMHQEFRKLLKHTAYCERTACDVEDCHKMKLLLCHVKECRFKRGCTPCRRLALQLYHHHNECFDLFCRVPMCFFPWKD